MARKTVFFIYGIVDESKVTPMGTGFFLQYIKESNPEKAVGYMVTAKHVLLDINNNIINKFYIRIKSKENNSQFIFIDLEKYGYFLHENSSIDIIIIPYYPYIEKNDFLFVNQKMILDRQLDGFKEGDEVFFPGLFIQYPGIKELQPILRFGHLSMIPSEELTIEIKGKVIKSYFYLIECLSFNGNSGSPVFFKSRFGDLINITIGGIITGSYHHTEFLPYDTVLRQNTGIAIVTPSFQLLEILNSKKVYEERQKHYD